LSQERKETKKKKKIGVGLANTRKRQGACRIGTGGKHTRKEGCRVKKLPGEGDCLPRGEPTGKKGKKKEGEKRPSRGRSMNANDGGT